ncbi:iron chelate uptake ABC transporter family permease subunit [Demequina zhanjiangensis]|uniref:Iron chelate uptake ABC transporter family permease subunit n=1 Tax=Demequina zhanjiangensis TaxID=3051659 RepID=A0ABT8G4K3_9MICO|nr:iron chelate uptake ABC transporter family permease subunit [Demequina sp. SYSU T00b26]MDN4474033.1 iron chelate uptake ABC transporter family permease subunit [Demequina sp. SYSU T00b26]
MEVRPIRAHAAVPVALAVLLALSIVVAVTIGVAGLTVGQVWDVVASHLGLGAGSAPSTTTDAIVWGIRLPRVLTAALVGAGLATAGVVMQGITRNPLADPYLLGLSSGASLGAVSVLLLGIGSAVAITVALPVAAFVGALVALVAALGIARLAGAITPTTAVLAGLAMSQLFAAATSLVIVIAAKGDSYREVLSWLLGSLAGSSWSTVAVAAIALVAIYPVLRLYAPRLDAFALGESAAEALGIPARRTYIVLFVLVAALTGAMVSTSGAIGFVGLVLPHVVRALTGGLHRRVLPAAALGGAIFLVWADTLARTVLDPREIPVGVVTALIGVPVFVLVLWRSGRSTWS